MKPVISIIYVYYNTPLELVDSINSIPQAIGNIPYEIIIVDNASSKKIPVEITKNRKIKIVTNRKNIGYGPGLNVGVKTSKGNFLLLTNPDVIFKNDAINKMFRRVTLDRSIGILGPLMLDSKKKILPTISGDPSLLNLFLGFTFISEIKIFYWLSNFYWMRRINRTREQSVGTIGGACFMISRKVFDEVGGFDENFFMYFEEADLCYRVKKLGYKIIYYPKAQIVHLVGRSSQDKKEIKDRFQKSRYYFLRKYNGFLPGTLAEGFIRFVRPHYLALLGAILVSLFLNTHKLNPFMLFIGDMGRDYLAARDMILTGIVPLVGIPSSVVWLHQGPLSIYFIAVSLFLADFNPIAPAVFYGILGVGTTFLVYILGKNLFNDKVGLLSSLFLATSPLIVINARMPYHTAPIPFFTVLFFLVTQKILTGNKKLLFILFFILGLLLQLELSNAVLIVVLMMLFLLRRPNIIRSDVMRSVFGLTLGILPFILFDLTHSFVQTLGFPLWVINRIRLFLGLTLQDNATTHKAQNALATIWENIARIIFPASEIVVLIIVLSVVYLIWVEKKQYFNKKNLSPMILLLWIVIPVIGFIVHAAPAPAYFPLLFPGICLMVGYTLYRYGTKSRWFYLLFILLTSYNTYFLLENNFFVKTAEKKVTMPPGNYSFGYSFVFLDDTAKFIAKDAQNKNVSVKAGGFLEKIPTADDNLLYLAWLRGVNLTDSNAATYTFYEVVQEIPKGEKVVYSNEFIYVTKDEN